MKMCSVEKVLVFVVLVPVLFGITAGTADAFNFRGYTYNETGGTNLSGTNVTIEEYTFGMGPPTLIAAYSNSSNATGYFNVSVPDNTSSFYKIKIKHFNGTYLDYIGQSLPEFPYGMIQELTMGSPMKFYLKPGGTINITANNGSAPVNFFYMIKLFLYLP